MRHESQIRMNILFFFFITILHSIVQCSSILSDIIHVYEKFLTANGYKNVDVDGLKFLINSFHQDHRCFESCAKYLQSLVGNGLSWDDFEKLAYKIYGDEISDDPYQPQEIHLSLLNDKSSMKVMFVTMSNLESPFAEYSLNKNTWIRSEIVPAVNFTYRVEQKWWPVFTGVIYEADMINLQPETAYYYRVGGYDASNKTTRYSETFSFKSAPIEKNPNRKTVITTFADHGTFMLFGFLTVNKLVELKKSLDMDFVFIAGDLSYAGLDFSFRPLNITSDDEFEHVWDLWGIQNQPISAYVPWMIGVGNHEAFYNWTAVSNRYKMPQNPALQSYQNFWYDFDYANVHWISLSSEHDLSDGSPQKNFLISSLNIAKSNRQNIPWIVITIHKPLYCSDTGTPGGYAALLESTFLLYDVDLVVTGHMHVYERIHPVNQSIVTVYPVEKDHVSGDVYYSEGKGPVYVVQGNSGAMQWEQWLHPAPAWSAVRFANGFIPYNNTRDIIHTSESHIVYGDYNYTNTFGFGVITVYNSTHLHYDAKADTESRLGTDRFWVIKTH